MNDSAFPIFDLRPVFTDKIRTYKPDLVHIKWPSRRWRLEKKRLSSSRLPGGMRPEQRRLATQRFG